MNSVLFLSIKVSSLYKERLAIILMLKASVLFVHPTLIVYEAGWCVLSDQNKAATGRHPLCQFLSTGLFSPYVIFALLHLQNLKNLKIFLNLKSLQNWDLNFLEFRLSLLIIDIPGYFSPVWRNVFLSVQLFNRSRQIL